MEWVCLVKMAGYIGLYFAFVDLDFHQLVSVHINAKIKKNEITINAKLEKRTCPIHKPSWPYIWSLTYIYFYVLQEQLHFAVQKAHMKVIAVSEVGHQPDGEAIEEMVRIAGQEQSFSVLNKPNGFNYVSDRRTASLEPCSFVKTIKNYC